MEALLDAYKRFFTNYAVFSGRSTRSDYWYVVLANLVIGAAFGMLGEVGVTLSSVYALVCFIPSLALVVRRLHDINKGGGWYFIIFLPLVGVIVLLVFLCTASVNEGNRFGERV